MASPIVQTREEALTVLQAIGHKWAGEPDKHSDNALILMANNALNPSEGGFDPRAQQAMRALRGEAQPSAYTPPLAPGGTGRKALGFLGREIGRTAQDVWGSPFMRGVTGEPIVDWMRDTATTRPTSPLYQPPAVSPSVLAAERAKNLEQVTDVEEAVKILSALGRIQPDKLDVIQRQNTPQQIIAAANAELTDPVTKAKAQDALQQTRAGTSKPTLVQKTPEPQYKPLPPIAPMGGFSAPQGGALPPSAEASFDPFFTGQMPSPTPVATGPSAAFQTTAPTGRLGQLAARKAELEQTISDLTSGAYGDPNVNASLAARINMAQTEWQRVSNEYWDEAGKASSAGGVSADTAAQIAASDRRAAAAEAFQREQEMQRVKEAMVNTRSRLMDLQAAAQQQGNQFVAENARWAVPAGSRYAPGREPDSLLGQAVTKAGYTFTPRERPTVGVDPFAQRKLIDDQVAQILEQMKSWGTGG